MPVLRLVGEVAECAFCLRTLPREDLSETSLGALVCADRLGCCEEYDRQEAAGWKDHPAFQRSA